MKRHIHIHLWLLQYIHNVIIVPDCNNVTKLRHWERNWGDAQIIKMKMRGNCGNQEKKKSINKTFSNVSSSMWNTESWRKIKQFHSQLNSVNLWINLSEETSPSKCSHRWIYCIQHWRGPDRQCKNKLLVAYIRVLFTSCHPFYRKLNIKTGVICLVRCVAAIDCGMLLYSNYRNVLYLVSWLKHPPLNSTVLGKNKQCKIQL